MSNDAFCMTLLGAAIPAGAASAIVGVWAYRAFVAWMVAG